MDPEIRVFIFDSGNINLDGFDSAPISMVSLTPKTEKKYITMNSIFLLMY